MTITTIAILVAVFALLLGGFAKGISGMGLPVVATPILTLLFDLQTAIPVVMVATLVTDVILLVKLPKQWGLIKHAAVLIIFGMFGIILGSYMLININQLLLSGILGLVILVFVVTSFFSLLPQIKQKIWLDSAVGLIGGTVQGAAGASGPIISMYVLQMKMSRNEFLFLINCFFVFIDIIQIITVYKLGLYEGAISFYALIALIPALVGLVIATLLQKRISDQVFRKSVLIVMTLSALVLLFKSSSYFI